MTASGRLRNRFPLASPCVYCLPPTYRISSPSTPNAFSTMRALWVWWMRSMLCQEEDAESYT